MSGWIILKNGYSVQTTGSRFHAIMQEITARLDTILDQDLIHIITDSSGVVDAVDLVDLRKKDWWPGETAHRFEEALKETYRSIAFNDDWRVLTIKDDKQTSVFKDLAKLVEIGLFRDGNPASEPKEQ